MRTNLPHHRRYQFGLTVKHSPFRPWLIVLAITALAALISCSVVYVVREHDARLVAQANEAAAVSKVQSVHQYLASLSDTEKRIIFTEWRKSR